MKATAQIFLSYAREDEERVGNLYQKLSDAGFKPWMDKKDILPGEQWKPCIAQAIQRSDFFLACLSASSVTKRGVLQKEIKQALDTWEGKLVSDIYLIPVRLEDCEVPEGLYDFQWVNLFEEDGWARLVKAIQAGMERRRQGAEPTHEKLPTDTKMTPPPGGWPKCILVEIITRYGRRLVVIIMFLVFGVLSYIVGNFTSSLTSQATAVAATTATRSPTAVAMTTNTPVSPADTPVLPTVTPAPPPIKTPIATLGPTPTTSPAPQVTPMLVQAYALPLSEPFDVVYDGSDLYALFLPYRLVKLELVEAEKRFRAAEQQPDFTPAISLAWDASRGEYWAVRDAPGWVGKEIDLIDRAGNRTATFTVPQTFVGYPKFIAWDGEYLWVTSNEGPLYKVQLAGASGELRIIDSYAPSTGRFPNRTATGLTWDGNHLWLLVDDILSKLNQVAQPICRIELPSGYLQPSWSGWRGLAWDGQFLWVAHSETNKVYRVDPAACQ